MVSLRQSRRGKCFLSEVVPHAAFLASLSACLLPSIPVCPAVQRSFSEYFAELLFTFISLANLRMLSVICYPGLMRSDLRVSMGVLSSVPSAKVVLPVFSVLMRCIPSSRPICSASPMVCSVALPR